MEQEVMNRNASQLVQSNRPASRRLHRRPVHTPGVPYVAEANTFSCTPATVAGLPQSMVREAGMFELLAAEMRIAELEAELAEARVAACTDPLTGALNRRGFDNASRRELSRARRSGAPLALVHVDLDDFKQVNDDIRSPGGRSGASTTRLHIAKIHAAERRSLPFRWRGIRLDVPRNVLAGRHESRSRFLREFSAQTIPGTGRSMTFSCRCRRSLALKSRSKMPFSVPMRQRMRPRARGRTASSPDSRLAFTGVALAKGTAERA
jgi:hypothetical protein